MMVNGGFLCLGIASMAMEGCNFLPDFQSVETVFRQENNKEQSVIDLVSQRRSLTRRIGLGYLFLISQSCLFRFQIRLDTAFKDLELVYTKRRRNHIRPHIHQFSAAVGFSHSSN